MAVLQVKNLSKRFWGIQALDKVSFEIEKGEIHGLVGENGAGKSTLVKILAGIHQKDEGEISVNGEKVDIDSPYRAVQLGLSFIHQQLYQVPDFTVAESLFFGRTYPRNKLNLINWKMVRKKAQEELSVFIKDINNFEKQPIRSVPLAYRYLIDITKSISQKCKIIFMDEPTASLSEDERDKLFDIIDKLKKKGVSIVYISHQLEEIFRICDRVTILRDGKRVGTYEVKDIDENTMIHKMLGKALKDKFPKRDIPKGEECLRVVDIEGSKVPKTSFNLHRGEILGFIGLVGSGRTELARLIFGVDKKKGGEIYVDGKKVNIKSPRKAIKSGISLIPEDRQLQGLILNMAVKENITLANLSSYCLKYIKFINFFSESKSTRDYIDKLRIKVADVKEKVKYLSGGNQQKVAVAKWMDTKSKIFIFDEPTKGIDVGAKTEIYLLIQRLAEEGAGIILISSEIEEILGISDRFFVLYKGKIVGEFRPGETTANEVALKMQFGGDNG